MATTAIDEYDYIVIGAGIMGLSTAWHLLHKEQAKVLIIEQWPFPNTRGSSVGHTRIFRRTYPEPVYIKMVDEAIKLWNEIEDYSGKKLLNTCGLLLGGAKNHLQSIRETMIKNNCTFEKYLYRDIQERYPQLQNFSKDEEFIFDPTAGFVAAQEAMEALHGLVKNYGGVVKTREKLVSIESSAMGELVHTNCRTYRAKSVVLTMGPWIVNFLRNQGIHLPMKARKAAVCYFKTKSPTGMFQPPGYPCVCRMFNPNDENDLIYGTPDYEFPEYVKFGHHYAVEADPDMRDSVQYPKKFTDAVIDYVRNHFPHLDPNPAIIQYCMYTETADNDFIIDRHPHHKNVIIGAGFSGHGFKMAPMVGKILAGMALKKPLSLDCSMFRIDRFSKLSKL